MAFPAGLSGGCECTSLIAAPVVAAELAKGPHHPGLTSHIAHSDAGRRATGRVRRGDIISLCVPGGSGSFLLLEQRRRWFRRKSAELKGLVLECVSLPIEAVDVVGLRRRLW